LLPVERKEENKGGRLKQFNELVSELYEAKEERLVVTEATIPLDIDEESYYEIYVSRVEIDGKVCGAISYESMEDALERATKLSLSKQENVSVRHVEVLKATIDELGFDRAIALLESLNKP